MFHNAVLIRVTDKHLFGLSKQLLITCLLIYNLMTHCDPKPPPPQPAPLTNPTITISSRLWLLAYGHPKHARAFVRLSRDPTVQTQHRLSYQRIQTRGTGTFCLDYMKHGTMPCIYLYMYMYLHGHVHSITCACPCYYMCMHMLLHAHVPVIICAYTCNSMCMNMQLHVTCTCAWTCACTCNNLP